MVMKERLNKADGLEETVRRQELVIEKLESMINNYMKEKRLRGNDSLRCPIISLISRSGAFNDVDRTFLSEHAALGLETQQIPVDLRLVFSVGKNRDFHSSDECLWDATPPR